MAMPYSLHASITRSSLMDPPGCAMYFTPLLCALCTLCAEREESIRSQTTPSIFIQPFSLFFSRQRLRLFGEELLPLSVFQHVCIIIAHVHIDRIVSVWSAHIFLERQVQYFWTLTKEPVVSFLSGQSGAVDPGLLSCSDTDSLTALDIAHRMVCVYLSVIRAI